ncbi:hypothetical protein BDV41DRAFT_532301 [Aspergillus transmontanensis]|uniref:Uncharacterized protein n=1 Tax=Aspergillus transmontanensis TaxID=1034304 RepID=A0A5N6W293_9EURO|nr:hypothetical protein BDV41DRAFT_532301 [Aspergillus transmontanensis]
MDLRLTYTQFRKGFNNLSLYPRALEIDCEYRRQRSRFLRSSRMTDKTSYKEKNLVVLGVYIISMTSGLITWTRGAFINQTFPD